MSIADATRGEELGLQEVVDIPSSERQDPTFWRTNGSEIGRDGCRVPIPWEKSSKNFGFGPSAKPHLPMPDWMGDYAVDNLSGKSGSTLELYRKALKLRRELQTTEKLEWVGEDGGGKDVLHFKRDGGWEVILNFEGEGIELPEGVEVLVSSEELEGRIVPKNSTVWFRRK